jgi:hypothetical protein
MAKTLVPIPARTGAALRLKAAASLACLVCFGGRIACAQSFDRNAWLQDYAALKQAIEKRYSNLAWFASPEGGVDLPALDRRTLAALKDARIDEDARSALQSFVRGFHDGHFSQLAAVAPPLGAKSAKPGDPVYSRQDPAGGCAALGFAPDGDASFSARFEALPGFHLLSDGVSQPFRAGVLTAGDPPVRLGIVRIPSFEESDNPSVCLEVWGKDEFWNRQGKLIRGALRQAAEQNWYRALADLLKKFQSEGVAAVLVDVGNNSGGDDSGDIAARLFTARPIRSAPLWMSQDQAASSSYFDEQLDALRGALKSDAGNKEAQQALATFTAQKEKLAQSVCPMDWVWRERREWKAEPCRRLIEAGSAGGPLDYLAPHAVADARVAESLHWPAQVTSLWGSWTGPLYVLTDNRTYSAAEMFAAVLQNNRAARIVGSQTGGDGCGFMNSPEPVVLPTSGLRFRLPNCVRLRADGTDEVAGVKPDIPVLPAEGENARARAMRIFNELAADLKRSSAGK